MEVPQKFELMNMYFVMNKKVLTSSICQLSMLVVFSRQIAKSYMGE